tara:strand:+ start:141 stop:509 length:369 start_codon:yes stop_codon:yes gene_type:complete
MPDENNCPSCGAKHAYVGIMFAECPNRNCELYTEQQEHIARQIRIAEIKIKEEQGQTEELSEEKKKITKDFLDTFVKTGRASNNTATVPVYNNNTDTYTDDDSDIELTPWNYHLYEEEDYDD